MLQNGQLLSSGETKQFVQPNVKLTVESSDYSQYDWAIIPHIYNVYVTTSEYTDATGDVDSCPAAPFAGMEGNWIEGAPAVIHLHERYMEMAVRHQTDLVFLLEAFCGHGYHHDDPESPCYRGPDAELWFDFTCIHPNPAGHAVIAEMFEAVVAE